jgi:hypothetical protein
MDKQWSTKHHTEISNMNATKKWGWTLALRKGKQPQLAQGNCNLQTHHLQPNFKPNLTWKVPKKFYQTALPCDHMVVVNKYSILYIAKSTFLEEIF